MSLSLFPYGQALQWSVPGLPFAWLRPPMPIPLDIKHSSGTTSVPVNPQRVGGCLTGRCWTNLECDGRGGGGASPTSNPPELLSSVPFRSLYQGRYPCSEPDFEGVEECQGRPDSFLAAAPGRNMRK